MDDVYEIGDLVMMREGLKSVAIIIDKSQFSGRIHYDLYFPNEEAFSYSWEGWELNNRIHET